MDQTDFSIKQLERTRAAIRRWRWVAGIGMLGLIAALLFLFLDG